MVNVPAAQLRQDLRFFQTDRAGCRIWLGFLLQVEFRQAPLEHLLPMVHPDVDGSVLPAVHYIFENCSGTYDDGQAGEEGSNDRDVDG